VLPVIARWQETDRLGVGRAGLAGPAWPVGFAELESRKPPFRAHPAKWLLRAPFAICSQTGGTVLKTVRNRLHCSVAEPY
jgi:hypothetical protein